MEMKKILLFLYIAIQGLMTEAGTYYTIANGHPGTLTNWNSNPAGGGTTPANFSTSGDLFIIQGTGGLSGAPHTMITTSTWTTGNGVTLQVRGGAVLQANSAITINAGGTFILDSAATYNHNHTGAYASQILQGVENFHVNSNFIILNSSSTGPGNPSNGGFGNLMLNSLNSSSVNCAGALTQIKNNLIILQTGNAATLEFRLTGNTGLTLSIGGNLEIYGGILTIGNGTAAPVINLSGDFIMSGGEFKNLASNNPNIQTLNFTKAGIQNFIKSAGTITALTSGGRTLAFNINPGATLNMSNYVLDNGAASTATFNLASGGGVKLGHAAGISSSGATGNVQVTGTRSFSKGANYEYNGTVAQISGNGIPDTVRSLTINNTDGLTLSNASLTDTVQLVLVSGRIKTDATHSLLLAKNATIASFANIYGDNNEGFQNSFVSGPLQIEMNTTATRTFPVGKDTLTGVYFAPVKLTPFNTINKIYTVQYYPSSHPDPVTDGPLHHVSTMENWIIDCNLNSNPDADALVGLSWRPMSNLCFPVCNTADSIAAWTDLAVAHYFNDGSSTKWRMDGGIPPFTMRTGSTLSYGYITTTVFTGSFSPFTLGSKSDFNFLPLKLIAFKGEVAGNNIVLHWITEAERNCRKFLLQKSMDGSNFTTMQTISANNTNGPNFYSGTDLFPLHGDNYYRLLLLDKEQKATYSPVIKIKYADQPELSVYPNPANNYLYLNNNKPAAITDIKITSLSGMEIPVWKNVNNTGGIRIDIQKLPSGWYILSCFLNKSIWRKSFFKN
jgi:hypothetical protein